MSEHEVRAFVAGITHDEGTYRQLFSHAISNTEADWSLGFVVMRLDPVLVEATLRGLDEAPSSQGMALGLGELRSDTPAITQALFNMLKARNDYDAWWCAADALEKLGHGDATDLKKRTLVDPEWSDLPFCLERLGQRPAVIGVLRNARLENTQSVIVPRCREALEAEDRREVQNAVWLLERLRVSDHETLMALSRLHEHAEDLSQSMRPRIVEAFGQIAAPQVRDLLEHEVVKARYFRTRAYAATGLGRIGDPRSLPSLKNALRSESEPSVVASISEAIYAIQDPRVRAVQQVVRDSRWPENGMIVDESNYWYGAPEVYDAFANAEDPQGVSLDYLLDFIPNDASVLELGMGTGRLTFHGLRSRNDIRHWTAVDASEVMCHHAKTKSVFQPGLASRLSVINGNSSTLPFSDETFDVVVSAWAFPSRTWNRYVARAELREVHRVLKPQGCLITLGWDELFQDELSQLWYRFVPEPDFRQETLDEWRSRRRSRLSSTRNCGLTFKVRTLRVPLLFPTPEESAHTLGFLFGHSAGEWIARERRTEFSIDVGVTHDTREQIEHTLEVADSE